MDKHPKMGSLMAFFFLSLLQNQPSILVIKLTTPGKQLQKHLATWLQNMVQSRGIGH